MIATNRGRWRDATVSPQVSYTPSCGRHLRRSNTTFACHDMREGKRWKAEDIKSVACVGGGTIGFSWAVLFAKHGIRVNIYDISDDVLSQSDAELRNAYATLVAGGVMTEVETAAALDRITTTTDLAAAVGDVEFVQESRTRTLWHQARDLSQS